MPITETTWDGQPAVELTTEHLRLVAVYGFGPRIAWYGPRDGENLLFWPSDPEPYKRDQRAHGKPDWYLRGGHRLWVSRHLADESAETYRPDNHPGTCTIEDDGFLLIGAPEGSDEISKGFRVRILDERTLAVEHIVHNDGDMLYAAGAWGLTCTKPGANTRYVIPLGDGTSWDTASITFFRTWAGHGQGVFADDQYQVTDDAYVLTPGGRENKRMVKTPAGVVAMIDPDQELTFCIEAEYESGATYPGDANLALYIGDDNFMVEMETMGALAQVKPGFTLEHTETWTLLPEAVSPTGADVLSALRS